jgi:hypothetical protein
MGTTISIYNPALFEVLDTATETRYYGTDQNWFKTWWQRYTGCGPSVASNLVFYRMRRADATAATAPIPRERLLSLMEDVWEYVTPTRRGIPTTKLFRDLFENYAEKKGIRVETCDVLDFCDETGTACNPPALDDVAAFLEKALSTDHPVAFLNLCNGHEANLDEWHWVTVVSMRYDPEDGRAVIGILDEGEHKEIDLALWLRTTKRGGGFVYFSLAA